jgi:hypothetical protein
MTYESRSFFCVLDVVILVFSGETSLINASVSKFPSIEICQLLVASKANVAHKCNGKTALQYAIDNNNLQIAAYLRSIGAPQ